MHIVETRLTNVCQFTKQRVKFKPGLVGVFGRNGTGKSNMLKLGGYASLTNDFTRNKKPKDGNIRYGLAETEKAYIETIWEHNGQEFTIVRGLQNVRDMLSSDLLDRKLQKAGEISEWLAQLTGLPNLSYLLDNYVFVEQGQLTAFLSEKSEERAKGYAQLCGTTVAETCWDAVGKQINTDVPLTVEVLDNSDELQQAIGNAEVLARKAKRRLIRLKQGLFTAEKEQELKGLVQKAETRRRAIREFAEAKLALEEARKEMHEAQRTMRSHANVLHQAEEAAVGVEEKLINVKTQLQTLEERQNNYTKRQRLERELRRLVEPTEPKQAEPAAGAWEAVNRKVVVKEEKLEKARRLHKNVGKKGLTECSHCGTLVANMAEHIAEIKRDIDQLPGEIESLTEEREALRLARNAWELYRGNIRSYHEQKLSLEKQVAEAMAYEPVSEDEGQKLCKRRDAYQAKLDAVKAALKARNERQEPLNEVISEFKSELKSCRRLYKQIKENTVDKAAVKQARHDLKVNDAVKLQQATWRERRRSAETTLGEKKEELERLRERIAQTSKMREWVQLLRSMREVLHRDRLPKRVHEGYQQQLLPDANKLLAKFQNPFQIDAGPGLGFVVEKPDGTIETAECLSGGEQGVLALAVRWSVHALSAAGLGLLVLDEPTAGLDEANMQYLQNALPQLGDEARSRGLQVIVVTHESSLKPVFDQIIELSA